METVNRTHDVLVQVPVGVCRLAVNEQYLVEMHMSMSIVI